MNASPSASSEGGRSIRRSAAGPRITSVNRDAPGAPGYWSPDQYRTPKGRPSGGPNAVATAWRATFNWTSSSGRRAMSACSLALEMSGEVT
jgi:hypothetical protein